MESRRPGQSGTRDKRIRMEIRERGREIGRVSERKNAKGEKTGRERGERERDGTEQRYKRGEEDAWKTRWHEKKRSGGRK